MKHVKPEKMWIYDDLCGFWTSKNMDDKYGGFHYHQEMLEASARKGKDMSRCRRQKHAYSNQQHVGATEEKR